MCLCVADLLRAGQNLCLSFVHSAVKMRGQGLHATLIFSECLMSSLAHSRSAWSQLAWHHSPERSASFGRLGGQGKKVSERWPLSGRVWENRAGRREGSEPCPTRRALGAAERRQKSSPWGVCEEVWRSKWPRRGW